MKNLLAVSIILFAGSASADDAALRKLHFERATEFVKTGDHRSAIVEYQAAYDAVPHPNLLYNIGRQYQLVHLATPNAPDARHALDFYKRFLNDKKDAANRSEVDASIADLESWIAKNTESKSEPSPIPSVEKPAIATTTAGTPQASVPSHEPSGTTSPRRRIAVALAIGGAALALGGGILAGYAASSSGGANTSMPEGESDRRLDTATTERNIGVVIASVGAVAAVAAIVVFVTSRTEKQMTAWIAPSANGFLEGRF